MNITVQAKQAGKKHALIKDKTIEIEDIGNQPTVAELLLAVVASQVKEFNNKPTEKNLLPFLDEAEISNQSAVGKVGFGSIYNERKADVAKAQQTALQAFEDGMFLIFAGDEELKTLIQQFQLTTETVITFIRLTFLAGSYW